MSNFTENGTYMGEDDPVDAHDHSPVSHSPTTDQAHSTYLHRLYTLVLAMAMFSVVGTVGVVTLLLEADGAREELLKCTAAKYKDSPCQKLAADKDVVSVSNITKAGAAYVLCADRLDGDEVIKACVERLLEEEAR